jgi:uncharacterized membrane protein YdjX (TVP38/TMEM64 family)
MTRSRLILAALILAAVAVVFLLDLDRFLSIEFLRTRLEELQRLVSSQFAVASLVFFVLYATLASLSVPGAALVFTLGGGALFGVAWGSVLVSFASSIGGTLACLLSRFLLREFVERKFPYAVERVNRGIREDGAYYLFGLRLVPVFPFFIVNLVMGLTRLPLRTFYWVSQLGMLPGTVIFVNAGTQLARIENPRDILAPDVAASLALLGLFPLVSKKIAGAIMAWHRRHP